MAQWTPIDPNTLLPGDPWTSAKAQAAFENVEAVAEGAPGAPRVQGRALAETLLVDFTSPSDGAAITITDLPPYKRYGIYIENLRHTSTSEIPFRISFSGNNGASYNTPRGFTAERLWFTAGAYGKIEVDLFSDFTVIFNAISTLTGLGQTGGQANDFSGQMNAFRIDALGANMPSGARIVVTGMLDRIETS